MTIPYSAYLDFINASVAMWAGFRLLKRYRKTGHIYTAIFAQTGFGVAISIYFSSVPMILFPNQNYLAGALYIVGLFPLFWGLSQALRFVFIRLNYLAVEKIIHPVVLAVVSFFAFLHFIAVPYPEIINGVVIWNIEWPFNMIFATLIGVITLPVGILFISTTVESKKALFNKILFGLSFLLAGVGGAMVTMAESGSLITWSYIIESLGFLMLVIMFTLDPLVTGEQKDTKF